MKKNLRKFAIITLSLTGVTAGALGLAACGGDNGGGNVSELIGRFTSTADREVVLCNDKTLAGTSDGENRTYIYTSDLYPLNTIERESVVYSSSQTLRLKRDYTYEYSYDLQLKKVTQDGNTDLVKMEVLLKGVFVYSEDSEPNFYSVELAKPETGEEVIYGAAIADEGNIYSWRQSTSANYRMDAALAGEADRYTAARTVRVERGEERVVYDNVFYADLLNDVAPFCSYAPSGAAEEKPDKPVTPDEPEKKVTAVILPEKQFGKVGARLIVDGVPAVEIITEESVSSVTVGGTEITEKRTENGLNFFIAPVVYADFGKNTAVKAGGESFDFNPAAYLKELANTENSATLKQKSLTAVCVSLLNAARELGADITLTSTENGLVYESLNNNYYHTDWGMRDNLTVTGGGVEGFGWNGVPALLKEDGVKLEYKFFVNSGDYVNLKARFTVGEEQFFAAVTEVKTDGGKTYYSAKTENLSPLSFDGAVRCEIFDGETKVSGIAEYSVTRACARTDLSEDAKVRDMSRAIYSLGMSAAWFNAADGATYSYYPPVNGGGRYELKIGTYAYNDGRMDVPAQSFAASGNSVYVQGTLTGDGKTESEGSGFTVTKTGAGFFVTLGGATVDGIRPSKDATENITVYLSGTSEVSNVLLSEFGDGKPAASVKSYSDLIITGRKGAVLNVYGNMYALGNIVIENVTVNVYGSGDFVAAECRNLNILGGELNVKYNSNEAVSSAGIACAGGVYVNGYLRSEGYAVGLALNGTADDGLTVDGGGLEISAENYGVSGADPETCNREFLFNGGESEIVAGNGIKYGNVTLGNAALTVTAQNGTNNAGYTVEAAYPVTIRTVSGDSRKGALNLVNKNSESFFDVNYTVKVENMLLNGGSVYIYGLNPNGVVHTVLGSVITAENCDLVIENGQDLATAYGRAIAAQNGDELITVANTAKLVFKNCDAAIACWGKSGGERFAHLENNGLIILDTYKVGLAEWELNSWQLVLTVENRGQIRTTNYLGT